jgi:Zn-dependent protease
MAVCGGIYALLFAHEMGHFIAARQRGLDVGAPTFIPFLGAWINMKDMAHCLVRQALPTQAVLPS